MKDSRDNNNNNNNNNNAGEENSKHVRCRKIVCISFAAVCSKLNLLHESHSVILKLQQHQSFSDSSTVAWKLLRILCGYLYV
jgi:hypothetical protein